jgi:valyl-tRNA synthetase
MIFSGIELLGEVPFRDVIIHSTVLARDGRRMSKSLGTGIDAREVVEQHGADAARYGLMKMSSTQDVRFSDGFLEEGRKLANKLWNVARLILAQAGDEPPAERPQELEERWILARLSAAQGQIEAAFAELDFAEAASVLYHVTFDDFCDWYAEAIKPRLYGEDADARATGIAALERLLKLLHPVMPHVTEEIWSNLPARESRLIVSPWPEAGDSSDAGALERVQAAAATFRRSGVLVPLEGDEKRIFDVVVKPERQKVNGNAEAEIARLHEEIARAEGMLANDRFTSNAPAEVVEAEREKLERYRRELAALSP